jgi:hypothetical protein
MQNNGKLMVNAKRARQIWATYWSAPSTKSVFTYFATNTKADSGTWSSIE